MTKPILTQARLKELLHYNPDTGVFTRLVTTNNRRASKGSFAGLKPSTNGYCRIAIDKTDYFAHRLVMMYMEGVMPELEVDHINHIKHDNRFANLRHASNAENKKNLPISTRNTSGISGVSFDSPRNQWMVRISIAGVTRNIGRFYDFFEACCVRKSAEIKYGYHINHGGV